MEDTVKGTYRGAGAARWRVKPPTKIPTVVEEVAKGIKAMIMAAEFRPGERLLEEDLAARFGVSRPPVREALRSLLRDGIVKHIPRKGFIVIPITADDVREIYELRWILERAAVEKAVPVSDPARLEPLRAAIARMEVDSALTDADEMLAANTAFHTALVDLAGNSRLAAAYATISTQLTLCMAMNLRFRREISGDPRDAARRHRLLLDLLEAGDLPALQNALDDHGDRAFLGRLGELIGQSP